MIVLHSRRTPPRAGIARIWLCIGAAVVLAGSGFAYWYFQLRSTEVAPPPGPKIVDPVVNLEVIPVQGDPWFRDMTADSGLTFTYRNGEEAGEYTILETLGGGVALLDYNQDGLLDIFVTGGGFFDGPDKKTIKGLPCKLYKNLGNWKFEDVTKQTGLDISSFYTHGVAVADYDCDGWPDLLVTGYGQIMLWHNELAPDGNRRFVNVSEQVGLRDSSWSTSAGWADIDGDGYPDLYVCHYVDWSFANHPLCAGQLPGVKRDVCAPQRFKPLVHALFKNEASGKNNQSRTFRDVSAQHQFTAAGCGLGVILADFNDDGIPDIYVANDATNNFLFMNRKGKLEEKGFIAGVAVDDEGHYNGSMGVDAADFDGSGRASLFVTNFQGDLHALYQNLGNELFQHLSRPTGIAAIGMHYVGFGTGFIDVDNDGWEDIVFVNGHVLHHPILGSTFLQRPVFLRNVEHRERRFFKDYSAQAGPFFQKPALGRGLAIGDLDNDGWPDLVVSHTNSPVALLRNQAASASPRPPHWVGIKLFGDKHRDIVGSTIILKTESRTLTRFAKGGGSYLSAGDQRILFGLGSAETIRSVTVKWSWGKTETFENLTPDSYWELHEGVKQAKPLYRPAEKKSAP